MVMFELFGNNYLRATSLLENNGILTVTNVVMFLRLVQFALEEN